MTDAQQTHMVPVGHGMVGQRFLEALTEAEPRPPGLRITALAEEPRRAYDRVHLTSWFSGTTAEELSLCGDGFAAEHGIDIRLGDPVETIDGGGDRVLRRKIQDLGVTVHIGAGTRAIVDRAGRVAGMVLSDGTELATDLVVFSAGVRPRDRLARAAGPAVGERGGIVVDEYSGVSAVPDSCVFRALTATANSGSCSGAGEGALVAVTGDSRSRAADARPTLSRNRPSGRRVVG
ncbi:FAD-dependent oxidoreductase [Embleya sp. NPDC020630]|uniref:FAD-dependent oxidoreductase n=1 Tax=Embleya sp. NPDC020630 TaxID=3363979 RepID=UPI00379658C7